MSDKAREFRENWCDKNDLQGFVLTNKNTENLMQAYADQEIKHRLESVSDENLRKWAIGQHGDTDGLEAFIWGAQEYRKHLLTDK